MVGIFSRHRSLALLASVVLAQLLLLAFQIKRDHDIRLIRYWAVGIMSPVERGGTWGFSSLRGIWTGYIDLHNAREENQQLRAELGQLQLRNRELESQANEAGRLSAMLSFHEAHPEAPILAAQVIGASADSTSHTLFINRGTRDHIHNNMAVVTPDGVVGKIVEAFPSTSQVLLINDRESGVGALFAGSRTHGVVKGSGDPNPRLDYIVNDEKVKPGDVLLTSGDDRIFPKGLLIGTVIDSKPALPFQLIHVQPAARLDRLEDVLVLLSQQEFAPKKTGEASVPLIPDAPPEPTASATDSSAAATAATSAKPVAAPAATNTSATNTTGTTNSTGTAPPAPSKPNDSAAKPHTAAPSQNPPVAAKPAAVARQ
jgi:rod shape-determining protein MreC